MGGGFLVISNYNLLYLFIYGVTKDNRVRTLIEKRWHLQCIQWERRVGRKMIRPGLSYSRGLLTLAACLERKGFHPIYLNYSDPIDRADIYEMVKAVDIVCITVLTPTLHIVVHLSREIKLINPNVVIVLGGPHITALPVESLQTCSAADIAMIGECEERLPDLLKLIKTPERVAGTVYREGDTVQISPNPIKPVLVSELPLPAYHLLRRPLTHYAHNIKMTSTKSRLNWCINRK